MTLSDTEKKINERIGAPALIQSSTEFLNLTKFRDVFRFAPLPRFMACFAVIYFGVLSSDVSRSVSCGKAILWLSVLMWLIAGALFIAVLRAFRRAIPEVYWRVLAF